MFRISEHSPYFKYYVSVRPCVSILCLENTVAWNTSVPPWLTPQQGCCLPEREEDNEEGGAFQQDQGSHHFNQIASKFRGLGALGQGSGGCLWHIAAYSQNSFMCFYFIFKKKEPIKGRYLRKNNAT